MIENREYYRVPFRKKFIFSEGEQVFVGNTENLSLNGVFVKILFTQFKPQTKVTCLFELKANESPIRVDGIIKRISASSVDPSVVPGLGIMFQDSLNETVELLKEHLEDTRRKFELASTILSAGEPDIQSLKPLVEDLNLPPFLDLGELKFSVDQVLKSIELVERKKPKT